MFKLYEIDSAIMECFDEETGEIFNSEALNALLMMREKKIENVVLWVKNLTAEADAIEKEKKALAEREKVARNKVESLKNWLIFALDGEKFKTPLCAVSFRNTEKVAQMEGAEIPEEYRRVNIEVTPNKEEIKKALKSGKEVKGFYLQPNRSITIK